MRRALLAILFIVVALHADRSSAEPCDLSTGYSKWSAVATTTGTAWSGCTTSADDNFTISGGEVVVTGDVTLTTGTITCSSGKLRVLPGVTLTYGTRLTISSTCEFDAQGEVLWEGRVASDATYAAGPPATHSVTVQGASPTAATGAATTDYLYFGDDDDPELGAPITSPIQTGSGNPEPGYYRPAFNKWAWADINAVSSTSITYNVNNYSDIESLPAAGVDPYGGTRGPGLTTATAPAATVRTRYGLVTKIQADLSTTVDGDFGSQYVVWQAGTCSGDRNKIAFVDANSSPTNDDIYVWGDVTKCGTSNIKIDAGVRPGDPIKIIRPPTLNGSNVGRIDITGGTIRVQRARIVNAFPGIPTGLLSNCNLCIYKASAGATPPTGYMREIDMAFPGVAASGSATAALGVLNQNAADTAYPKGAGETFSVAGMEFDRWYIHDQRLNSAGGTCPGTCEGVHGVFYTSSTGGRFDRFRIERLGDDGIFATLKSYGANDPNTITVRAPIISESLTSAGANSQQCIDYLGGATGSATVDLLYTSINVTDALLTNCEDGIFVGMGRNVRLNRAVLGGGGPITQTTMSNFTSTSLPADWLRTYPNYYQNILAAQLHSSDQPNGFKAAAIISDSIIGANLIGGYGGLWRDPIDGYRTFVDLNDRIASSRYLFERGSASYGASSARMEDVAIVNTDTVMSLMGPNFNTSPYTALTLSRVFFGVGTIATDGFFYNTSGDNGTVSGSDITIAQDSPNQYGARGLTVTGAGANLSRSCVETTLANALTGATQFGASRTATSYELTGIGPDAAVDSSISAIVRQDDRCERPRSLGLAQVGLPHALLGDGFVKSIANYTTNDRLIRLFRTSSRSPIHPGNLVP